MRRVGGDHIRSAVDPGAVLDAASFGAPAQRSRTGLAGATAARCAGSVAAPAVSVDDSHLGVQRLVGQRSGTGRAHAPLALAAAGNRQHPAEPADRELVAIFLDSSAYFIAIPLQSTPPSFSKDLHVQLRVGKLPAQPAPLGLQFTRGPAHRRG